MASTRCQGALAERLEVFAAATLRPTIAYEVAFAIEALSLPDGEIVIGRPTFTYFDAVGLQNWVGDLEATSVVCQQFLGRTISLVSVQAGSPGKAGELAGVEVDTSLAHMRAAMASSRATALMDDLFWQRRARFRVAKELTEPTKFHFEFRNDQTGMYWIGARASRSARNHSLMQPE